MDLMMMHTGAIAVFFFIAIFLLGDKNAAKKDGRFKTGYKRNIRPAFYSSNIRSIGWISLAISGVLFCIWTISY